MVTEQLSDLQQKILKHFFECTVKNDTVSHISKEINSLQPAVFRSINSLIKENYLVKEKRAADGERIVKLTEKGAAAAILFNIPHSKAEDYLKKNNLASGLEILIDLFRDQNNKDLLLKKGVQYFLEKDWIRKTTLEEKEKMQLITFLLADLLIREKVKVKNNEVLKLINSFHLNSQWLITALQEKRRIIDLLINQLVKSNEVWVWKRSDLRPIDTWPLSKAENNSNFKEHELEKSVH